MFLLHGYLVQGMGEGFSRCQELQAPLAILRVPLAQAGR